MVPQLAKTTDAPLMTTYEYICSGDCGGVGANFPVNGRVLKKSAKLSTQMARESGVKGA